jgi:hypothetical protein
MNRIRTERFLLGFLIVAALALAIYSNFLKPRSLQHAQSNTRNITARGTSMLPAITNQLRPNSLENLQKAVTSDSVIADYGTLIMSSLPMPPSNREAEILRLFVRTGGRLFISIEEPRHMVVLSNLLEGFEVESNDLLIMEDSDFKNKTPVVAEISDSTTSIFENGDRVSLYSLYFFENRNHCIHASPRTCYLKVIKAGKGEVILQLGLSVFSNALVSQEQNRFALFRLLNENKKIAIDEYHHFFSDIGIWDLLMEPRVFFPTLLFVVLILGFFLFSRNSLHHQRAREAEKKSPPSLHALTESVLLSQLKNVKSREEALTFQLKMLRSLFPNAPESLFSDIEQRINKASRSEHGFISAVNELVQIHQRILKERRGLNP